MQNDTMGSSHWDTFQGYKNESALSGDLLVIGKPLPLLSIPEGSEEDLLAFPTTRHYLSVAPTRSGKGVALILPNLLQYRGSCIVIDPKGENAWITAQYRRDGMEQKVYILDPWDEVNRRYGDLAGQKETIARFNPLSILDPASSHYADDLAYLSDALIINQGKDPHWDDSARELVAGLIAYAVEKYGEVASLPMVRVMLSKPSEEIAGIAKEAQTLGHESVAARKLGRFVNDSREIASIVSTALTQTAFLDSAALGENLSASDFSFDDLVNGRATIYLVLPVDKLQTYGRWLRLMVSIGIRTVARNAKPLGLPVLFLLDEFGTIGRLSAVVQAYGLMAGLQMCIWAFVQDLVQLRRDYSDDWETFIGNSEGVTFFNLMDPFSCEYFSKALGNETVEQISVATAEKRKENPAYSAMADKLYSRPLLHADEIRTRRATLGVFMGRHSPLQFEKLVYYKDPILLERARIDPHFPSMKDARADLAKAKRKRQREKDIPDFKTAQALLEANGYSVEFSGLLSKSIKVTSKDKQRETFESTVAFLEWVRQSEF